MSQPREPRGNPEEAARLRAAFAYAGFEKADRAKAMGVSERTITRWESAENKIPPDAWDRVVEATNVPPWFFRNGFAAPPEPEEPTLAERLEALEHRTDAEINRLRAALALVAAGDLQRVRELLAPGETGRPPESPASGGPG